jgi:hypothetical protein
VILGVLDVDRVAATQSLGNLAVHQALRTAQAMRYPRRATALPCGRLTDMVLISLASG